MRNLVENITEIINDLEIEFQNSKALILSEDDLKCHVFRKLYDLFNHDQETMDSGIKGSPLHSEIKFFDERDKLNLIPDITILNPDVLSIIHSLEYRITRNGGIIYKRASSKEFEFGGDTIIIELKFCKNKSGITRSNIESYKKDVDKIKRIQGIVNARSDGCNRVIGIFILFNKTDKKHSNFQNFIDSNSGTSDLKIIYKTSNLRFEKE